MRNAITSARSSPIRSSLQIVLTLGPPADARTQRIAATSLWSLSALRFRLSLARNFPEYAY
jgi:hypothetical protein